MAEIINTFDMLKTINDLFWEEFKRKLDKEIMEAHREPKNIANDIIGAFKKG